MKVLQVASSLHDWGGIERYIHYLSEGLTSRGHEVAVTCPPGSPLDSRLNVPRLPITMRGKYNPASALPYLRLFRKSRYDVVHIHFSPDFQMPAWAAKVTRQKSVVMTRHVSLPWSRKKVRAYLKLFDHIVPVSDAVRIRLQESGIPPERMTVAKAGVPAMIPSLSVEESRQHFDMGGFVVGSFGRLVKEKGTDILLEAIRKESQSLSGAIFGAGPELDALKSTAPPNARFYGRIEQVADAMNAVDVVAIPSVWEEAFPYSALEAMSLGKPIVASNVGGMPEMVQSGINGLLFPKGDVGALAEQLDTLRNDPSLGVQMGEAGRQIHRSEFTVAKMAQRMEQVYLRLLAD